MSARIWCNIAWAGGTARPAAPHRPPWSADEAREDARRLLGRVAEGCATKKPGTVANDRSRIERHIKPLLGRKRGSEVTRGDVERLLRDVAEGKTKKDEKLGSIFTFAMNRRLRPDNPARGIKKFTPRKVERFLTLPELARPGVALSTAAQNGENPLAIAAIRLLILTGCRRGEVLGLKWAHVDFQHACLRLPDSKTGAKVVPLGAPALQFLAHLPRAKDNPYVLPGIGDATHLVGLLKVWQRVQAAAELDGVRIHDLRHSFASVAVAGGDSLFLVGRVPGHKQSRTTQIYAHVHDDPLRAVADRTANVIATAMAARRNQRKLCRSAGDEIFLPFWEKRLAPKMGGRYIRTVPEV